MFLHKQRRGRGFTLIEMIVAIVIIGVAVAGIMLALGTATRNSADPVVQEQALAIAKSLLEEVESMPFTYCDPDDPNVTTAASAADCTGGAGGPNDESKLPLGSQASGAGETRYSTTTPFDNVSDYNGFSMISGIRDINNTAITGLEAYSASITVATTTLGSIPAGDALQITVTVTGPAGVTVTLDGYRARYAPDTP